MGYSFLGDYEVDRRSVEDPQGFEPNRTNKGNVFLKFAFLRRTRFKQRLFDDDSNILLGAYSLLYFIQKKTFRSGIPGAWSERVTPLPIPNRVVKPLSADGTSSLVEGGE